MLCIPYTGWHINYCIYFRPQQICGKVDPGKPPQNQALFVTFGILYCKVNCKKKMLAASKEKDFEDIKEWIRGERKHLHWCFTSTLEWLWKPY